MINKIIRKIFEIRGIKDDEEINKRIYEWARGEWVLMESKFSNKTKKLHQKK